MVRRLVWFLPVAAVFVGAVTYFIAQNSPALRAYCLRIEQPTMTLGECLVYDDSENRICIDKDCDCACGVSESWLPADGCSTTQAVLYYDATDQAFYCESAFSYNPGTNTLTVGTLNVTSGTVGIVCGGEDQLQFSDGTDFDCSALFTFDKPTSVFNHYDVSTTTEYISEYFTPLTATGPGTDNYVVNFFQNSDGNNYIDYFVGGDGNVFYQPCCTTGDWCLVASAACPADVGMQVLGDLYVRGTNGDDGIVKASSFEGFSPTKIGDPIHICTDTPTCSNYVELDNSSNDLVVTPLGGDSTFVSTLTVDGTNDVTITDDADLSYTKASGTQPLVTHDRAGFATPPYSVVLNASSDFVTTYAMGGMSFDGKASSWSVTFGNASAVQAQLVVNGKFEATGNIAAGGGLAGLLKGYNQMTTPTAGGDYLQFYDGTSPTTQIGEVNSDGTNMAIWWGAAGTPDCTLKRTGADELDLSGCDLDINDQLLNAGSVVTVPIVFSNYIEQNQRNLDEQVWGAWEEESTGNAINTLTSIDSTVGISKVVYVLNTCSDSAGDITVTGTSVNRNTGATTGSDTSVITVSGLTTDGSSTDTNGNTIHGFTNAYITDKWFTGSISATTSDVNCTNIDVYMVAFEQVNDTSGLTFTAFDLSAYATNTAAWLNAYCYILDVSGDTCSITAQSDVELTAATVEANKLYRLRRGNLGVSLDGSTDGFWCETFFGPDAQTYWNDISMKVWFDRELF